MFTNRAKMDIPEYLVLALFSAFLLRLMSSPLIQAIGYYLFGITILLSSIYVFKKVNDTAKKGLMLFVTLPVFISLVFEVFNWPYANVIDLLMLIPILAYLILLFKKSDIKSEIGFLTIIAAKALTEFLRLVIV
ncbi:MAG: hypothetical protein R2852_07440 [Bacteroidia bacterium]